jgi:hypothetical protein
MALSNSFFSIFLFCWLVVGSGGEGGDGPSQVIGDRYFYSGNNSLVGKVVSSIAANATFPGFNFGGDPAVAGSGMSRDEWAWVVNVTDVEVDDGSIVSQTTHTLRFPEQAFPDQNATDWTACAYTFLTDIPRNLTSPPKTNDGSCAEVLGDACLAAFVRGTQERSPDRPRFPPGFVCPHPPYWLQLPECAARLGYDWGLRYRMVGFCEPSPSTVSPRTLMVPLALMNITTGSFRIPGNNGSLHSNEVYWSERSAAHPKSNSTPFDEQADREHFMMLAFAPSNEWIWANSAFPLDNTRVLPMCLRASGGNHVSGPMEGPAGSSAAAGAQVVLQ